MNPLTKMIPGWPQTLPSESAAKAGPSASLEHLMVELASYGKPRLSMVRPGLWHASIEMNTSAVGATFDVKAEFDHATPMEAVTTLSERMHAALARMGAKG